MTPQPSPLKRLAPALVVLLMLASLALHLTHLDALGDANAYYTAAVKSMLQSWHNFFFVAAEPGGSVTVDKPPLGLWIEAAFAFVLGVSGFSVSLPNILAGVFSIPLLYAMVKKHMGELAGLIAGLVMTVTPIFVATNRNNTMDGLLVFFLLLAAWAFVRATETGRGRWVMLGALIVGLGFNIKMLQAFLPLPAFYALYFFGSKEGWMRKIVNLGLATVLLAVVSLSWAVAVDLTPADQRPYIGSSGDNTVMGLITGHNGGSRLFGGGGNPNGGAPANGTNPNGNLPPTGLDNPPDNVPGNMPAQGNLPGNPPRQAVDACTGQTLGAACSFDLPNQTITGTCITPPQLDQLVCAPEGRNTQPPGALNGAAGQDGTAPGPQNGPGGRISQETGAPGVFRFFTAPLSKQMSWMLPFALVSLLGLAFAGRVRLPLDLGAHKALVLWGGWLGTCLVFFSAISGIFHAYYAIMLAPALGAVVGIGFAHLWAQKQAWASILLGIGALLTLAFQAFALTQYGAGNGTMIVSAALFVLGLILLAPAKTRVWAYASLFAAMLVIPTYWTTLTVINNPNGSLPTAFEGGAGTDQTPDPRTRPANVPSNGGANSELLTYLEANTVDVEYLAAVPSAQTGAPMVIATGRPVLYMGGFGGQDQVVTADDLAAMVANGELRFVLYGGDRGNQEDIQNWLDGACSAVEGITATGQQNPNGPGNQGLMLYDCAP
ncbi:MAG: glycosyltransferase family 39 protein [Anaerolineales bacterium]|nr:glycosyltransferase family 39 protein [Anaerolineales bacterium]